MNFFQGWRVSEVAAAKLERFYRIPVTDHKKTRAKLRKRWAINNVSHKKIAQRVQARKSWFRNRLEEVYGHPDFLQHQQDMHIKINEATVQKVKRLFSAEKATAKIKHIKEMEQSQNTFYIYYIGAFLFDKHAINSNQDGKKRVCDVAVESISEFYGKSLPVNKITDQNGKLTERQKLSAWQVWYVQQVRQGFGKNVSINKTFFPNGLTELQNIPGIRVFHSEKTALLKYAYPVVVLHLRDKEYRKFPPFILKFNDLISLGLSDNSINRLPQNIKRLSRLQQFILNDNNLTELPESISKLQRLKELAVRGNKLTSLPRAFADLDALEVLDLRDNQLEELPNCLDDMHFLDQLQLSGNPLSREEVEKLEKQLPDTKIHF